MYVRKTHHLTSGKTQARGHELRPGETLDTLIAEEIADINGIWNTITLTHHNENKTTIHGRNGTMMITKHAPDIDITFYIAT